jgi:hypothetical protein
MFGQGARDCLDNVNARIAGTFPLAAAKARGDSGDAPAVPLRHCGSGPFAASPLKARPAAVSFSPQLLHSRHIQ